MKKKSLVKAIAILLLIIGFFAWAIKNFSSGNKKLAEKSRAQVEKCCPQFKALEFTGTVIELRQSHKGGDLLFIKTNRPGIAGDCRRYYHYKEDTLSFRLYRNRKRIRKLTAPGDIVTKNAQDAFFVVKGNDKALKYKVQPITDVYDKTICK